MLAFCDVATVGVVVDVLPVTTLPGLHDIPVTPLYSVCLPDLDGYARYRYPLTVNVALTVITFPLHLPIPNPDCPSSPHCWPHLFGVTFTFAGV